MYRYFVLAFAFALGLNSAVHAQQAAILGKWKTSDKDIIEFYSINATTIGAKQISTETEKDKPYNGAVVGKDLKQVNPLEFDGTVIDPSDNKVYNGRFIIAADHSSVELKIKWGFLTHSETWTRVK